MTLALVVLGGLSVIGGFVELPGFLERLDPLGHPFAHFSRAGLCFAGGHAM